MTDLLDYSSEQSSSGGTRLPTADLRKHLEQLRRAVEGNKALDLNPEIRAALSDLEAPIAAYGKAAAHMVSAAIGSLFTTGVYATPSSPRSVPYRTWWLRSRDRSTCSIRSSRAIRLISSAS